MFANNKLQNAVTNMYQSKTKKKKSTQKLLHDVKGLAVSLRMPQGPPRIARMTM